jgi:hypothetical protein
MKNTNDLKEIWKQNESTAVPSLQEVTTTANGTLRKTRNKLFLAGLPMAALLGFLIHFLMTTHNEMLTTKIGLYLICSGILLYLIVSNSILNMFLRNEFSADSLTFLYKLIELKRKLELLYKTIVNIYFAALTAGIFLVLIEKTMSESLTHKVLTYVFTAAWIAFACFVLRPREMKNIARLAESVNALQNIRNQFAENG